MSHDLVLMNFIINSIVTSSLVVVVHGTLEIAKKTNFNISLLQFGAKLYHKVGNFLLPFRASVFTKLGQLCIITNWGKRYYKLRQLHFITNWGSFFLLQIGASVITNWGSLIITNEGKFYYKSGQLLQVRAIVITNLGSYYKFGQTLLQIRAAITNWGDYYKLGHNCIDHIYTNFYSLLVPTDRFRFR